MQFPYKVSKLTKDEVNVFNNYFANNNEYIFEGVWFRSQNKENKINSGYVDNTTKRRRTLHYRHTFYIENDYLMVKDSYIYLSVRLPLDEYYDYVNSIKEELINSNYNFINNEYKKDDIVIIINEFDKHPEEEKIDNYKVVDIIVKSNNLTNTSDFYTQVWKLQVKGIREKDKRGNPEYITDIRKLEKYLPAQVELGCGPSIEAGIMPLYYLHEIYKVQRHSDGKFYFGKDDDLILQIIKKDKDKFNEFYEMMIMCIKAKPTLFHKKLKEMYEKNILKGDLLNNNFDRLCKRIGINEKILRVYNIENYFPKIEFDKNIKSLICIGTHADRRGVQKQAREKGLKIIYIDPEGFETGNGFEEYLIEGASDNDLIFRVSANSFANLIDINNIKIK